MTLPDFLTEQETLANAATPGISTDGLDVIGDDGDIVARAFSYADAELFAASRESIPKALYRYGTHHPMCRNHLFPDSCTCGLTKAIYIEV